MFRSGTYSASFNTRNLLATGFIFLAALAAASLVKIDENLALVVIAAAGVLLFAFLNTNFALSILILSMLLSPEFSIGGAGGVGQMAQRNIVIRIDDLLLALILLSWLVKTAVNKELGVFIHSPLNVPMFAYAVASLFATLVGIFFGSVEPMIGILYNVKYFQYFLIYFMVLSHVKSLSLVNRYIALLLITSLIVSVYAIWQIPSGARVSAPFEGEAGEANTLGGYLVIIIGMIAGLMTGVKRTKYVVGLGIALLFVMIPFIYTLSRSSWIAMIPLVIALVVYSPKRKAILTTVFVTAIFLPAVLPSSVYERIEYTFSPENARYSDVVRVGEASLDPSTSERIQSWASTVRQWMDRPFFGWGVTGAGFKDAQYFRVLAETGVLGFILFIYLLVSIYKTAMGSLKRIDPSRHPVYHGLVVGYIAAFFGLVIHAIGANTFIIVRVMEPFWFLTALIVLLPDLLEREDSEQNATPELSPVHDGQEARATANHG